MKIRSFVFLLILLVIWQPYAIAQAPAPTLSDTDSHITILLNRWTPLFGSFLEPNRFSTSYDFRPNYLRLEAGYGGTTLAIGQAAFGAECLVWSGLRSLSNFRFPVETADYFFGLYSVFPIYVGNFPLTTRVRLSHISSHWVDGVQDSIVGGSSSRFSREFVGCDFSFGNIEIRHFPVLRMSIGARYVFHQVTHVETAFSLPIALEIVPVRFGESKDNELLLSLSNCAGAYANTNSVGVIARFRNAQFRALLDIYGEYHSGATRYGTKGIAHESGFEAGVRVGENLLYH